MTGWAIVGCALAWDVWAASTGRTTMTQVAHRFQRRHPACAVVAWVLGGVAGWHLLVEPQRNTRQTGLPLPD